MVDQAIKMIEGPANCKVVERHAEKSCTREPLRMIRFGLDKTAWQPQSIDALGDTLCEFEHRFSKHSTDLGHVIVDPFRIVLKQDAIPLKQKPYRHSPVLAAKVRTEIYKLLLADILCRSYSIWASPWWTSRFQLDAYG